MITSRDIVAPEFYQRYINLAEKDDVKKALKKSSKALRKFLKQIPAKKIDYAYAPGKWTIKELLQHVIDAERVFAFRALWFARKDVQPLPGFDENTWAASVKASERDWDDLIDEFKQVRQSTETLFRSFGDEELRSTGTANNNVLSVAAIGYITAGHVMHHINILKERYLK